MTTAGRKLIIIGAGSLGVMTLDAAISENQYNINDIVFIDDGKEAGEKVHGITVIGGIERLTTIQYEEYDAVIAIANNKVREKIAATHDLNYVNIIHPQAVVSKLAHIGVGNIIMPNVSVDPEAIIHNHVIINKNTSIGHNTEMKNFSQVSPGCQLGGTVGKGTFIGLGASLLPNIKIGDDTIIGAGAVVTKDIPEESTAVGIPAKVIKH